MAAITVGDRAPNFDLSSTEDVLLMLRDEVPRMAILLYFFQDPANSVAREDLQTLSGRVRDLAGAGARILAISPTKVAGLKALQQELDLRFPLLCDDRDFSAGYGLSAEEGADTAPVTPVMLLIDRDQTVLWIKAATTDVEQACAEIMGELKKLPSSTVAYPKSVINRIVDRLTG